MLKTVIIGASGYTGAELAQMVHAHPHLELSALYVSEHSLDANKPISALYGQLKDKIDLPLLPLTHPEEIATFADIVILATAHEVSHDLAPIFLKHDCCVFDLSGAYRVRSENFYPSFYGFQHQHTDWLEQAVYGLAEWQEEKIKTASLVAVPGCYPTASQLALKPLIDNQLLDLSHLPVINAVSGVSGAGRKASIANSFCEVSLHAYGVFTHRHQPEIAAHLGTELLFTPHLGNFKRGILATISAKLADNVQLSQIESAIKTAYKDKPLVRVLGENQHAKLQSVQHTGFCDIGWSVSKNHIILTSAIDNLLKGAASQAMQCINIRFGFAQTTAITGF